MQLETAIVHVYRAHKGHLAVHQYALAMKQARREGVDLHSVAEQFAPVAFRHQIGKLMIGDTGHQQLRFHAAVRRHAQGTHHWLVNGQIRRGNGQRLPCAGDHLQKGVLSGVDGVVIRSVHKGLDKAFPLHTKTRPVLVIFLVQRAAHSLPQVDKLTGQSPCALSGQPHAAILPIAETLHNIGVFVCQIGASGIRHLAVDTGDLPVVTVIEVQPVHILMHRIEDLDLDPDLL